MQRLPLLLPRIALTVAAASALTSEASAASIAPPAAAAATSATACASAATTRAFFGVDGDTADYALAPGGSFELGAPSWTLAGGARIADGNESLGISPGKRSLVLPAGGTATSPAFCIDETNPHFRFGFRVDHSLVGFQASLVYPTASGPKTSQITSSKDTKVMLSAWQASRKSPLSTLLPLQGGSLPVQIKLTGITATPDQGAVAEAASQVAPFRNLGIAIDSVMVDPYRRS